MSTNPIILYDLASPNGNHCWSPNPWKIRMQLNYKGLEYRTEWLEYPEIKARFEKQIPPNAGLPAYTIPTVQFPDGTYMQDSEFIAKRIEELYPEPSVHLESPYKLRLQAELKELMGILAPEFIPKATRSVLNEASWEYWNKTRSAYYNNMPLDQVEKEYGGDHVYEKAQAPLKNVTNMLRENAGGPFFQGSDATYADFIWAGLLVFMQRLGHGIFDKVLREDREPHLALLEGCKPWLERDNY